MPTITSEPPAAAPQPRQDSPAAVAATPEAQDRTERFCKRLDEHMEGLPRAERLPFLERQRGVWERRYDAFQQRVAANKEPEFGETAWDYRFTIDEISKRIGREQRP